MDFRWYFFSIMGLLLTGLGLCVFGEALIQKINKESYFALGTLSLVIFNTGICFVGEAIFIKSSKKSK